MPRYSETATLVRLRDAGMTVTDPEEDIRGRKVVDKAGAEIGQVEDLFIDEPEKKVRFLHVGSGGFLGFGERRFLIPVDAVVAISGDTVRINQSREHVAASPPYEPALSEEAYYESVYSHYGLGPYWVPGYLYPAYPRYRPKEKGKPIDTKK